MPTLALTLVSTSKRGLERMRAAKAIPSPVRIFDASKLPNPHRKGESDAACIRRLHRDGAFSAMCLRIQQVALRAYETSTCDTLAVIVHCAYGRHRSVAVVDAVAALLSVTQPDMKITVHHALGERGLILP